MDRYYSRRPYRKRRRRRAKNTVILLLFIAALITAGLFIVLRTYDGIPALGNINTPLFRFTHFSETVSVSADITAANVCVMIRGSDSTLYEKSSFERIAPASTTKMLTALTVLDHCSADETFTVGDELDLVALDASRAWLDYGDVLTVRQLLTALLLPSGNDAAYTLAVNTGRKISGDDGLATRQYIELFVAEMNKKAAEIGAASSYFITPDGYDAEGQYTTAYDLALIAGACLDDGRLSEIMGSFVVYDTWPNGREATYYNTNELLNPESAYYCPGVVGLKTGNSSQAGGCLVSAAVIDGKTYICVIMGSTEEGRFLDSISVYNAIKEGL